MKIRNGFVSNSSSSSFVVFGFKVSEEEIIKLYGDIDAFYDEEEFDTNSDGENYYIGQYDTLCNEGGYIELEEYDYNQIPTSTKVKNAAQKFDKELTNLKIFVGTNDE
jgi:hypothetical protein